MAIAATAGAAASTTSAVASKANGAFNLTNGRFVVTGVALDDTTKSLTSVTDTGSNTWTKRVEKNGTGIRVELWTAPVTSATASRTITATLASGTCNIAIASEEYSGVTGIGNTDTGSGNTVALIGGAETQEGSNYVVSILGFACQSGDTLTAFVGISRQSSIPAATSSGIGLYDNTVQILALHLKTVSRISTAREWASATLELLSGGGQVVMRMPEMSEGAPTGGAGVVIY